MEHHEIHTPFLLLVCTVSPGEDPSRDSLRIRPNAGQKLEEASHCRGGHGCGQAHSQRGRARPLAEAPAAALGARTHPLRQWPRVRRTSDAGLAGKGRHKPIRIHPGSTWENGYNERFNGTLRREVLNAEWFTTTKQAQIVINQWLRQYNHVRPHQALGMRPPVPETILRNDQNEESNNLFCRVIIIVCLF